MSKIKTGGPAFPHMRKDHGDGFFEQVTSGGMALRDYFAAKAMPEIKWSDDPDHNAKGAAACYAISDAMLAAREVQS